MALTLKPGDLYYLQRGDAVIKAVYKGHAGGAAHWFNIEGDETFLYEREFVVLGVQEPLSDLTAAGDSLQSAASRLATGVRRVGADRALGYEDRMALHEIDSAVAYWTEARR